jgi:hypothetical protein
VQKGLGHYTFRKTPKAYEMPPRLTAGGLEGGGAGLGLHEVGRMGWQDRATTHGFRALAATPLEEGLDPRVMEQQLAHYSRRMPSRKVGIDP